MQPSIKLFLEKPLWQEPLVKHLSDQGIVFPGGIPSLANLLILLNPPKYVDHKSILAMELAMTKPFWQFLSSDVRIHPLAAKFVLCSDPRGAIIGDPRFSSRMVKGLCISPKVAPSAAVKFLTHRMDLESLKIAIWDDLAINAIATCGNLKKLAISQLHTDPLPVIEFLISRCPMLEEITFEIDDMQEDYRKGIEANAASLIGSRRMPNCVEFESDLTDHSFLSFLIDMDPRIVVFDFEDCRTLTDVSLGRLATRKVIGVNLIGMEQISPTALKHFIWHRSDLQDLKVELYSRTEEIVQAIGTCENLRSLSLKFHTQTAYACLVHIFHRCKDLTFLDLQGSTCTLSDQQIENLRRINDKVHIVLP
ncbi:MAG: hypothetical protein Q8K75_03715 [Chlamydiales bacterium]|nr:hypothetical protein [Chlamydiales bacterium]